MANRYIPPQSKEKNLETRRKYHRDNADHINELKRKRREENLEETIQKRHYQMIKGVYGMTPTDYEKLLIQQNHSCAICKQHESNFKTKLAVDHNHTTNEIRGLLCNNCNNGLGRFKDNTKTLIQAIQYLIGEIK